MGNRKDLVMRLLSLAICAALAGCAPSQAPVDNHNDGTVGTDFAAFLWSPQRVDSDAERDYDSFITMIREHDRDDALYGRYGQATGYEVRVVEPNDFRTNYPIVVMDKRGNNYEVENRSRDHRAIVRFYVELMVAEGEVAGSSFQESFLASAM